MGLFLSKVGFIFSPKKNNGEITDAVFAAWYWTTQIAVDVFSYQPIFGFTMFWPAPGTPKKPFRESSPTFDVPKRWGTGEASWWNAEKRGKVLKLGLSALGSKQLCWFFKPKMDLNGWSLPASLVSSRYHCKVYLAAVLVSKIIQSLVNWVVELFFAKLFGGCLNMNRHRKFAKNRVPSLKTTKIIPESRQNPFKCHRSQTSSFHCGSNLHSVHMFCHICWNLKNTLKVTKLAPDTGGWQIFWSVF